MKKVKKAMSLFLSVLVAFSFIVFTKAPADAESAQTTVKVKLADVVKGQSSVGMTVNGLYLIKENNVILTKGTVYTVSIAGSGVKIEGAGRTYTFSSSFNLEKQDNSTSGITLKNCYLNRSFNYIGDFRVSNESGKLVMYNFVGLETYLYGVVAQEMSNGYNSEALKAQAIAARTFAYNRGFYVTDDTTSQAYTGYRIDSPNVINAVNNTKGMVLTYNGELVKAYYSARNGGYTETLYHAWGSSDEDYYVTKADDADGRISSTAYISTYYFSKDTSVKALDTKLNDFIISQIKIQKGYADSVQVKINKFTKISTNTPPNNRYPSNSPIHTMAAIDAEITANGQVQNVAINIKLSDLSKSCGKGYSNRVYTVTEDSNYIVLKGSGTPHGIGLSQMGAQQRAKEGETYKQILAFYYQNASISTIDPEGGNPSVWYAAVKENVNLRKGPSTSYSIIKELAIGTKLEVLQNDITSWVKVQLTTGEVGYVSSNYIITGEKPGSVPSTGVNLDRTSVSMSKGSSAVLKASLLPFNSTDGVKWSSSNANIASVDGSGRVTANNVGSAVITAATTSGKTATCSVYVSMPVTSISVNTSLRLGAGESYTLRCSVYPSNTTDRITWSSSNTRVATVNQSGRVTARAAGTARITVSALSGRSASCWLTVKYAPSWIRLNCTSSTLGVNETLYLRQWINSNSSGAISWSSSNGRVATVDQSGKVIARSKGTAYITVRTYNGKARTCKVTVKAAPTSIRLNTTSVRLRVNRTYTLRAIRNSGQSGNVSWSSSNGRVAYVNDCGHVTAKRRGTAYITVRTYNGKARTCKITVR